MKLREQADAIMAAALRAAQPDTAVAAALEKAHFGPGRLVLVAVGKAAWQMAAAAQNALGRRISSGVVITKYGHSKGGLSGLEIYEAGHPVPDANGYRATERVLAAVESLNREDTVLFLLSGGGSALFERPLCDAAELEDITAKLLAGGADILEMNRVRKRLSAVKGGWFARHCAPAQIFQVVLSDIVGDPLDMIASGPAYPDSSTCEEALAVVQTYGLCLSDTAMSLLQRETPKELDNVETHITGSVRQLCAAAAEAAKTLGYTPVLLGDDWQGEAREAGRQLGALAHRNGGSTASLAFIAGGETVVRVRGKGLGGRNQELALAAAPHIAGCQDVAVFALGSDGTDGPTDAAGGYVDGETAAKLQDAGLSVEETLAQNDAYHTLQACDGLVVTGPTGTNVNDLYVALIRR